MFNLSSEIRDRLVQELAVLTKERVSLQHSLRENTSRATAASEELFLELLEVVDALEFLLDYTTEHPELPDRFIKRLPQSLLSIQKKLLGILEKREVHQLAFEGTKPNFDTCRVVDREVRSDLEDQTITKIVRQGFCLGDKILRPIEVITSKTE